MILETTPNSKVIARSIPAPPSQKKVGCHECPVQRVECIKSAAELGEGTMVHHLSPPHLPFQRFHTHTLSWRRPIGLPTCYRARSQHENVQHNRQKRRVHVHIEPYRCRIWSGDTLEVEPRRASRRETVPPTHACGRARAGTAGRLLW